MITTKSLVNSNKEVINIIVYDDSDNYEVPEGCTLEDPAEYPYIPPSDTY